MAIHEYQIVGRRLPGEQDPTPQLYKMRIFAANEVVAKSRYFYFLRKLKKIKRSNGEVVSINEVSTLLNSIFFFNRSLKSAR